MNERELTEKDIAVAIKNSRKDIDRTYCRYRAVGKEAQRKLLKWLIQKGYISPEKAKDFKDEL